MPKHIQSNDEADVKNLIGITSVYQDALPIQDNKTSRNKWTTWTDTSDVTYAYPYAMQNNFIGYGAFAFDLTIKTISFGDGITSISDHAFRNCTNLVCELIIPDTVTTIGNDAFNISHLNASSGDFKIFGTLEIPPSVVSIGTVQESLVFMGQRGITELILHEGLTTLGGRAFQFCTSIAADPLYLPDTLVNFPGGANFAQCPGIKSIRWPDNPSFTTIPPGMFDGQGVPGYGIAAAGLNKDLVIPDTVTTIGLQAFRLQTNIPNIYCNLPFSGWGTNSLESVGATIYVTSTYVAGYDATWISTTGFVGTVATWTNYPNVPN